MSSECPCSIAFCVLKKKVKKIWRWINRPLHKCENKTHTKLERRALISPLSSLSSSSSSLRYTEKLSLSFSSLVSAEKDLLAPGDNKVDLLMKVLLPGFFRKRCAQVEGERSISKKSLRSLPRRKCLARPGAFQIPPPLLSQIIRRGLKEETSSHRAIWCFLAGRGGGEKGGDRKGGGGGGRGNFLLEREKKSHLFPPVFV